MRVVSLVPSSTETLLALGVDVVACSRFCEQPELLHVGGTKNPDIAAIVDLAPDLVVLDREENRIEDHRALVDAGLTVFVSDVTDLSGALGVVDELARATGATGHAYDVAEADIVDVVHGPRRSAFVPIWRRPWMSISAATYGASVLRHLGVDVVDLTEADGGSAYPTVELADVATLDPDLVVVPSEPYEFAPSHLVELAASLGRSRIVEVDGQDLFWWGIRTPSALDRLATALAPPSTP